MGDERGLAAASVRIQGEWWLPEHEDHKLPGVFDWSPTDGGTLEVAGELIPPVWKNDVLPDGTVQRYRNPRPRPGRQYEAIHGRRGSRPYTLLNAFTLSIPYHLGTDEAYERVSVNSFADGALYGNDLFVSADRLVVDLRHLTSWVGRSGISVESPRWDTPHDPEAPFAVIIAVMLDPIESTAPRGLHVRLEQSLSDTGEHLHAAGVEQAWRLRVFASKPVSDDDLIDVASDVRDIVTIATGKTATFDRVVLHHPDVPLGFVGGADDRGLREDIGYHARWQPTAEPTSPVKPHEMYFSFEDFGGKDGLTRWLAVAATYRTELDRIMATRTSQAMFLEEKTMNLAAVLDSFDRVRRETGKKRVDYVDRVKECVRYAGEPFQPFLGAKPVDDWAMAVKEARHDLAHHRERFRRDRTIGSSLLARQLYWLAVICLLRMAEAPRAAYTSIAKHREIQNLIEDAQRASFSNARPTD